MAGGRICAGYYRLFDSRAVNEDSLVADADTGRGDDHLDCYPFADVPKYCTSSKKPLCAFVEVDGEWRGKCKRLMNMKVSAVAIERLENKGFRGLVRKRQRRQRGSSAKEIFYCSGPADERAGRGGGKCRLS